MKRTHTPLVIGNWKMNPQSITAARTLFRDVQKDVSRLRNVDVGIAPPAVYLAEFQKLAKGKRISLAAQNVFWEKLGARTGEIGVSMLKSVDVTKVIIGHSERRALGETDEGVNKKVLQVLKAGLIAVVCVGEKERDNHGHYLTFVEKQLQRALSGIPKAKLPHVVIAYEPVWAIGTGDTATPEDAHEMKLFIQKVLSTLFGRVAVSKVRILYGGSVDAKNAEALLHEGAVDGFLVGGASLRASEFSAIVKTASEYEPR